MDWKELQENTKALTGLATQKLYEFSDIAAQRLHLKALEYQLNELYTEFGKCAYRQFTTEDHPTEEITKYVKAITLTKKEISDLKTAIEQKKNSEG